MNKNPKNFVCVLIVHFGQLPKWFDMWRYTAHINQNIDFHVMQNDRNDCVEDNIFYHKMSLDHFNTALLLKAERMAVKSPYKLCDFRPLFAEIFPDIIEDYGYWGWGDLDVIYGDVLGAVGASFGQFDYISTGWEGESGPLAFLRNCETVNTLWRQIPDVRDKLYDETFRALDEKELVYLLRANFICDIVFRECLRDVPARWKDGQLRSIRTDSEYALHHFGGGLARTRPQIIRDADLIVRHLKRGGALRINRRLSVRLER